MCVCVCAVSSRVRAVSVAPTRKKIFSTKNSKFLILFPNAAIFVRRKKNVEFLFLNKNDDYDDRKKEEIKSNKKKSMEDK